jgi:hypothetical protein
VPIITCVTGGAGAVIRLFGPEYIGGLGDIGARIDAEIARTGLPDEEIGPKVLFFFFPYHVELADVCISKRYFITQKENLSEFQAFLQCMITNSSRRRYVVF